MTDRKDGRNGGKKDPRVAPLAPVGDSLKVILGGLPRPSEGKDGRPSPEPALDPLDAQAEEAMVLEIAKAMATRAGMTRRELHARADLMPAAIRGVLSHAQVQASLGQLVQGMPPAAGFGLSGDAGGGKTMAVAQAFLQAAVAVVRRRRREYWSGSGQSDHSRPFFQWVHWPSMVNGLRVISTGDSGLVEANKLVKDMGTAPALMLDDLGAERLKGSYGEDWVANQLDLLVDYRHGALLPTWYTTNLSRAEFAGRYGARLFSRLCGENVLHEVPKGRDLRLTGRGV